MSGSVAGVAELKARLSEYLTRVKSGKEVLVTERGLPIARLCPLEGRGKMRKRLPQMAREGRIRLGTGRIPRRLLKGPRVEDAGATVRRALVEERGGGR